jgi:flagellar biosynthesis/type III secretory pathway chaperone
MGNELHLLIEQEIEILDRLNQLSLTKKEALLNNDLESLSEITLTEERLAQYFKKIDDACSPQVQFFLKGNTENLDIPDSLKEIIAHLRNSAIQLKANNQFNQDLLKDAIGFTKFTVNLLTQSAKDSSNTYGPAGKVAADSTLKKHLLDFKG